MKEEAILGLRTLELSKSAEEVKTHVAILKTQLNLVNMLQQLPAVIKEVEEQIERSNNKVAQFKHSQEGSNF